MNSRDVLSKGEINALMDSISSGDIPLEKPDIGIDCQEFDFSTREKVLLNQMPVLGKLTDKHAFIMTQLLSDRFKIVAKVAAEEPQLIKLEEVINTISEKTAINLMDISPFNCGTFLTIPGDLLSFLVNAYFGGGKSKEFKHALNDISPTEKCINDLVSAVFVAAMETAWKGRLPINVNHISFETNFDLNKLGRENDYFLKFTFPVQAIEFESSIDCYIAFSAIEPLRAKLGDTESRSHTQTDTNWQERFNKELLTTKLEVTGLFTSVETSIADVLQFRPGTIIPLKMPSEVIVSVDDQPLFIGEHGSINGKKSIKITEKIFS